MPIPRQTFVLACPILKFVAAAEPSLHQSDKKDPYTSDSEGSVAAASPQQPS